MSKSVLQKDSAKIHISKNISNSFINFCEKMATVSEVEEFLLVLMSQIPKKIQRGEILLFYESDMFGLRRAYIRQDQFYEESVKRPWFFVQNMSFSDSQYDLYLSEELGRPFSKSFIIPLPKDSQSLSKNSPLLFIEINDTEKNKKQLITFFEQREHVLGLAFHRVLLNIKFHRVSYLWKELFMNWGEPLAILQDFCPIQKNYVFAKTFLTAPKWLKKNKLEGFYKIGNKDYQIHYYPIFQFKKFQKMGLLYCQDMTEYFQFKEHIAQNKKVISLCKLGKNMTHHLNNPLTGIQAMAQILHQDSRMAKFKEELLEIKKTVERSQNIIKNLFSFSKNKKTSVFCDLNQAVGSSLFLLKNISQGVKITLQLCEDSLRVQSESSVLQQISYNVILNAFQSIQECKQKRDFFIKIQTKKLNKNTLCLKIEDNGGGISEHNLKKIFHTLWTSKKQGYGTGLGLSISKQFVRDLGGEISVTSKENKGACFTILLPLAPLDTELQKHSSLSI